MSHHSCSSLQTKRRHFRLHCRLVNEKGQSLLSTFSSSICSLTTPMAMPQPEPHLSDSAHPFMGVTVSVLSLRLRHCQSLRLRLRLRGGYFRLNVQRHGSRQSSLRLDVGGRGRVTRRTLDRSCELAARHPSKGASPKHKGEG